MSGVARRAARRGSSERPGTDVLVIGAGAAGLRAAIAAAPLAETTIVSRAPLEDRCSWHAQGGIAAALGDDDEVERHAMDTLAAGDGLCDEAAVRRVVEQAPRAVHELMAWGARFARTRDGALLLDLEGAHSRSRIVHASDGAAGRELSRCLMSRARREANTTFLDGRTVEDLVVAEIAGKPRVCGALLRTPDGRIELIRAKAVVIATGGASALFSRTTNPLGAVGRGVALGARAGAQVADMAFVQFHPTALRAPDADPAPLLTEALRGAGASIVSGDGRRCLGTVHPMGDLAPRDVLARAIAAIERAGDGAWLDAREVPGVRERFSEIAALVGAHGYDLARDVIPVSPAAHYTIGGLATDLSAATSVPGLYAAGECACTGMHGANRLASNSLLEALVMGGVAGGEAARFVREGGQDQARSPEMEPPQAFGCAGSAVNLDEDRRLREQLREAMWRGAGIERDGRALRRLEWRIEDWAASERGPQTRDMLLVAGLVVRSAVWRGVSSGCHCRIDAPEAREDSRAHDVWSLGAAAPVARRSLARGSGMRRPAIQASSMRTPA